ncbi:hypothetical protein BD769DRAFT_1679708 [Suillus cothurnatus]|nr:hypothetical protein BD769DRAFT_1679708 [Suillus cothurnatus]
MDRTQKKVESLRVTYVKHAAALKQTVGAEAKHLWGAITAKWPFFPNCHRIWATRPNINPLAVTTGVGPHSRCVTIMQPPDDGLQNIDPVLLAESDAACSSATAVPETLKSQAAFATDMSNTLKVPAQKVCHAKTPSISESALEKARASIKKLPQKHSFEDSILDLQCENSKSLDTHLVEERKLKKWKILIEELKLGVWTADEYRRKVAALEEDSENVSVEPVAHTTRLQSPLWDIEAGGELLSDQDDF